MTNTADTVAPRQPFSANVLVRVRASLLRISAAANEAERVVQQFLALPQVRAAVERAHSIAPRSARMSSRSAHESRHAYLRAADLLSMPSDAWDRALAEVPASARAGMLRHLIGVAEHCVTSHPERAHAIAA